MAWVKTAMLADRRARPVPPGHANCHTPGPTLETFLDITFDLIQWPAMAVTVLAAWLVASRAEAKRRWGFWLFLLSNVLWVAWGVFAQAYALITLQVCLAFLNIRGAMKNDADAAGK